MDSVGIEFQCVYKKKEFLVFWFHLMSNFESNCSQHFDSSAYMFHSFIIWVLVIGGDCRCQPWTITLTGVLVIGGSWLILNSVVITVLAALLISTWWYIFLYSYPKV